MSTEAMTQEKRFYPRHSVMRRATILLSPTQEIECVIRNISRDGAMIALDEALTLPPRFVLDLSGNIVVRRVCELIWQDGLIIGVNFAKLQGAQAAQFNL